MKNLKRVTGQRNDRYVSTNSYLSTAGHPEMNSFIDQLMLIILCSITMCDNHHASSNTGLVALISFVHDKIPFVLGVEEHDL